MMNFFFEHKNWILVSVFILVIGLTGMYLYKEVSDDIKDAKEFLKPIKANQ